MIEGWRDCNLEVCIQGRGGNVLQEWRGGEGRDSKRGLPERPSEERARTLPGNLAWEEGEKSNKNVKYPAQESLLRSMTVKGRSVAASTLEQGQLVVIKNIA